MKYTDGVDLKDLKNILAGMGIPYSPESSAIAQKAIKEHPDEEVAGAIMRYTNLFETIPGIKREMEETEEQLPFKGICLSMVLDARMQALDLARELNQEGVNLKTAGQAEILRDAEQIFGWMLKDLQ